MRFVLILIYDFLLIVRTLEIKRHLIHPLAVVTVLTKETSEYRQGGVKVSCSLDYKGVNAQTHFSLAVRARFTDDNYRTIFGATTLPTFGCVGYMWWLHIPW